MCSREMLQCDKSAVLHSEIVAGSGLEPWIEILCLVQI